MTADAAVDATPVRPTARSLPGGTGPAPVGEHRQPLVHHHPLGHVPPSSPRGTRSSAIFILKPWLPLVAFARLQQEHSSCRLGTSSSPSSLGTKKPMVERRKPIVTELALADALDQLVNLIEELRVGVNLPVEITTDDTQLLKISFSATPDVGFPLQRKVRDLPGQVVRRVWNEGLRNYETSYRSGDAI